MVPSIAALGAAILACAGSVSATKFNLVETYDSTNFVDKFDFWESKFYTGNGNDIDVNGGHVNYLNKDKAIAAGLVRTEGGEVVLGVDHKNLANDIIGRSSVKIQSKKWYKRGLIVARFSHLPQLKCGVWPAFWTVGKTWPQDGEFDIYEGWNLNPHNAPAFHTANSSAYGNCMLTGTGAKASVHTSNCDNGFQGGNQFLNQGCVADDSTGPWGSADGGVFALEWTHDYIKMYNWHPAQAPKNIGDSHADTASWGTPTMYLKSKDCNIDKHFNAQSLMFNMNFCGDPVDVQFWKSSGCAAKTGRTCIDYVNKVPGDFANIFFKVKDIRYFQEPQDIPKTTIKTTSTTSSSSTKTTSTSTTSTSIKTTSTTSTTSTSTTSTTSSSSTSSSTTSTPTSTSSSTTSSSTSSSSTTVSSSSVESTTSTVEPTTSTVESTTSETSSAEPTTETTSSPEPTTESTSSAEPTTESTSSAEPTTETTSSVESTSETSTVETTTSSAEPTTETTVSAEPTTETTSSAEPTTVTSTAEPTSETSTVESSSTVETTSTTESITETSTAEPTTESTVSAEPTSETSTAEPTTETKTAEPTTETNTNTFKTTNTIIPTDTSSAPGTEIFSSATPTTWSTSWGNSSVPTTSSVELTTSVVYTTTTYTITSCPPVVTNCPIGKVTTVTVPAYTTICPVSAVPTTTKTTEKPTGKPPGQTGPETVTTKVTKVYTITSCAPTVTNCPVGKVTTEIVTSTYCPPGGEQPTGPAGEQPTGPSGEQPSQTGVVVPSGGVPTGPSQPEQTSTVIVSQPGNNNGTWSTVNKPQPTGGNVNPPAGQNPGGCNGKDCTPVVSGGARLAASVLAIVGAVALFTL